MDLKNQTLLKDHTETYDMINLRNSIKGWGEVIMLWTGPPQNNNNNNNMIFIRRTDKPHKQNKTISLVLDKLSIILLSWAHCLTWLNMAARSMSVCSGTKRLMYWVNILTQSAHGLSLTVASMQPPAVHQVESTNNPRPVFPATVHNTQHDSLHEHHYNSSHVYKIKKTITISSSNFDRKVHPTSQAKPFDAIIMQYMTCLTLFTYWGGKNTFPELQLFPGCMSFPVIHRVATLQSSSNSLTFPTLFQVFPMATLIFI